MKPRRSDAAAPEAVAAPEMIEVQRPGGRAEGAGPGTIATVGATIVPRKARTPSPLYRVKAAKPRKANGIAAGVATATRISAGPARCRRLTA